MDEIFSYDGYNIQYSDAANSWWLNGNLSEILDFAIGSAKTTLFNLGIRGIVGMSPDIDSKSQQEFERNTLQQTLLLGTENTIAKSGKPCQKKMQKNSVEISGVQTVISLQTITILFVSKMMELIL